MSRATDIVEAIENGDAENVDPEVVRIFGHLNKAIEAAYGPEDAEPTEDLFFEEEAEVEAEIAEQEAREAALAAASAAVEAEGE